MTLRTSRVPCLVLVLLFASTMPAFADDWPRWRGARFDGTAPSDAFARPFELRVRWKRGVGTGYSAVVVAGGVAVTLASDGREDAVVALSAETGDELWRVPIGPTYPGREGAVDGPCSTPAIDGGVVYALGPRGDLLALRLATGEVLWRRHLVEDFGAAIPHWGFTTSPLVTGEHVVVLTGGPNPGAITALDKRTGRTVWRTGSDDTSYQSPMLLASGGRETLIAGGDRLLFALDPHDGRQLWSWEHGGSGFYALILNPVVVRDGALLLTDRPDESVLVRASGAQAPEIAWTTPHLAHNYAAPVVHGDYVYGFDGAILTCIDGRTGERMWRSREPGNGFPILVGDHLVVQTKAGSLHVAEASPDGYRESASLELFENLVWTPPSFAGGRVYARDSYENVACVDVVPASSGAKASAEATWGKLPDSAFGRWVAEVERAPDKAERVARFLEHQARFPIVEGERIAHVVVQDPADDLAIRASVLEVGEQRPMNRIAGTDLRYASLELEPDARLAYQFFRDYTELIADPRNPDTSVSLVWGGPVSYLFMPQSERASTPAGAPARGRIAEVAFSTEPVALEGKMLGGKTWGGERRVRVYLPAGYDADPGRRYPTLYVLYGDEMLDELHLDATLDRMIGTEIRPVIAVFVQVISPYEYARSQCVLHGRMLAEQLVPKIDAAFRTLADPQERTVFGVDEGGYAAVEEIYAYPAVVANAAALSVLPIGKGDAELLARIDASAKTPHRVYLDWGRYDQVRAADRTDVPGFSRRLRERLAARGAAVAGREWNDGSDLVIWGLRAPEALRALFALDRADP